MKYQINDDPDCDGMTNLEEYYNDDLFYTNPHNPDSDGDGLCDGLVEVSTVTCTDADGDGFSIEKQAKARLVPYASIGTITTGGSGTTFGEIEIGDGFVVEIIGEFGKLDPYGEYNRGQYVMRLDDGLGNVYWVPLGCGSAQVTCAAMMMTLELSNFLDENGNLIPSGNYDMVLAFEDARGELFSNSEPVPVTIRRFVYIHSGIHGPVAATDVSGNLVWRRTYAPFGGDDLLDGTGWKDDWNVSPGMVNLGFVSRQFDDDVGLYQLGHRWYDPDAGRFVSIDPILSSLNVYSYANNNPFVYSDANGLLLARVWKKYGYTYNPFGRLVNYVSDGALVGTMDEVRNWEAKGNATFVL